MSDVDQPGLAFTFLFVYVMSIPILVMYTLCKVRDVHEEVQRLRRDLNQRESNTTVWHGDLLQWCAKMHSSLDSVRQVLELNNEEDEVDESSEELELFPFND